MNLIYAWIAVQIDNLLIMAARIWSAGKGAPIELIEREDT